ncbi:MAG: DUF2071 domain-containing protein [Verrucomicrobiota bacterium]
MNFQGLERLRQQPNRRPAMLQEWHHLLFLHWEVNPELIQATLPDGLRVDTYEGKAYIGLVPFFMKRVRPNGLPCFPWLSNFQECNVRTYVSGPQGPGVWFYSLDCNQPIAVEIARGLFHLSYFHAQMDSSIEAGWVDYETLRTDRSSLNKQKTVSRFRYGTDGKLKEAVPESFEFFLVERYLLYTAQFSRRRLYSGRVWHQPYQIGKTGLEIWDDKLLQIAGFKSPGRAPDHVCYTRKVNVSIFGLQRI